MTSSSDFRDANLDNFQAAVISGRKFRDLGLDGAADEGEPGLPGWTVFLDVNEGGILNNPFGNGVCDVGGREMCAVTGQDGTYSIGQILPGVYRPSEVQQSPATFSRALPQCDLSWFTLTSTRSAKRRFDAWDSREQRHGAIPRL